MRAFEFVSENITDESTFGPRGNESEVVYHATPHNFVQFNPLSHFGTKKAAGARALDLVTDYDRHIDPSDRKLNVIAARLNLGNVVDITDSGDHTFRDLVIDLREGGYITDSEAREVRNAQDLLELLDYKDIQTLRYTNEFEDPGSTSYIITNPAQVRVLRRSIPAHVNYEKYKKYNLGYDYNPLKEMALPADWDPTALGHDKTFKSRLQYALERASKLGGGSSRVAFIIPDNGRNTVLKIAKNKKGLAQNEAEAEILSDGYVGQLPIVIPMVDYDKQSSQPVWIQTELAQKVRSSKLCSMLKCNGLWQITQYATALIGRKRNYDADPKYIIDGLVKQGFTEKDIETFKEYASEIGDLLNSTNLVSADLNMSSNWGIYDNRPVIIDLGFTDVTKKLYGHGTNT